MFDCHETTRPVRENVTRATFLQAAKRLQTVQVSVDHEHERSKYGEWCYVFSQVQNKILFYHQFKFLSPIIDLPKLI